MIWKQRKPWLYESDCKRYTVDRFPVPRSEEGYRFMAWRVPQLAGEVALNLGCYDKLFEAFDACTHDARRLSLFR